MIGLCAAVNLDDDFIRMGKAQNRTGALFQIIHIHSRVGAFRLQTRHAVFHLFAG